MDVNALLIDKKTKKRLALAARKLSQNFGVPDLMEDLIQQGYLALMEAAERYDPSCETSFDAYSDKIIKSFMLDYIYSNATHFTMPTDRFRDLRRVSQLLACGGDVQEVCDVLNVTPAVARKMIMECREVFGARSLYDIESAVSDYGNPEQIYTEKLQRTAVLDALDSLSSRSRTIIKYHLGLDQPDEQTMTFQDLAVRLNYNGHSAAEKAYKRAVSEMRQIIDAGEYGRWKAALRAVREAYAEVR